MRSEEYSWSVEVDISELKFCDEYLFVFKMFGQSILSFGKS